MACGLARHGAEAYEVRDERSRSGPSQEEYRVARPMLPTFIQETESARTSEDRYLRPQFWTQHTGSSTKKRAPIGIPKPCASSRAWYTARVLVFVSQNPPQKSRVKWSKNNVGSLYRRVASAHQSTTSENSCTSMVNVYISIWIYVYWEGGIYHAMVSPGVGCGCERGPIIGNRESARSEARLPAFSTSRRHCWAKLNRGEGR